MARKRAQRAKPLSMDEMRAFRDRLRSQGRAPALFEAPLLPGIDPPTREPTIWVLWQSETGHEMVVNNYTLRDLLG